MIDDATRARFLSKFVQGSKDKCWIWKKAIADTGYGIMSVHRKSTGAHRISWQVFVGEIPDGLFVLHNCPGGDNRACINWNHLWLGTHADNQKDKLLKGRTPKGNSHWNSKIKEDDLPNIFSMKQEGVSQSEIAQLFGVCQGHISHVLNGLRRTVAL